LNILFPQKVKKTMDKNKDGLLWFEYAENDLEAVTILSGQLKPKIRDCMLSLPTVCRKDA